MFRLVVLPCFDLCRCSSFHMFVCTVMMDRDTDLNIVLTVEGKSFCRPATKHSVSLSILV